MNLLNLVFNFFNLWSLLLVVLASNSESEIFQDSSSDSETKGKRSAALSDFGSRLETTYGKPESASSFRLMPGIVITSVRIPFGAYRSFSQRIPAYLPGTYGFRNRHVGTFVPVDRNNANGSNNRDTGSASAKRPDISYIPPRPYSSGGKPDNKTPVFTSEEGRTILSPELVVRSNVSRVPPISEQPPSSNIPKTDASQTKEENIPLNVAVNRRFPYRKTNNENSNGGRNNHQSTQSTSSENTDNSRRTTEPSVKATSEVSNMATNRFSPDSNLFAGMINDFAFDLVRILNLNENFVISPISIFIALSMCYLASDGSTKAQLEEALRLNVNSVHGTVVHEGMKNLVSLIAPRSDKFQFFLASGMFVDKNYSINTEFEQLIQYYYDAQLQNLNFGNPVLSMQAINNWVGQATRNTIPNFSTNLPHPLTRVLLLNAIYFRGIWKKQFPVDGTYSGRFFNLKGDYKLTPTMPLYNEKFPFLQSAEHKHSFIKLPYDGDEISMIIALPDELGGSPLPDITDKKLCHLQDELKETLLDSVTIPKFRLDFTRSLKNHLRLLGITDIFNPRSADLSNLRKEKDLYVSDIEHKAVVEVSEQGTIASAVTSVNLVPLTYRNTTEFVADHPFAFYIIHEKSGLVMFYGKIFDLGEDDMSSDD